MKRTTGAARALVACAVIVSTSAIVIGVSTAGTAASPHVYYVSPGGSDGAAGTQAAPWASFAHAQSVAQAGDTVYFRGGTYTYTHADSACASQTASVNAVTLNKSGSS